MIANTWHLAQTPDGPYAHQLDPLAVAEWVKREQADDPDLDDLTAHAEALGHAAEDIRAELGFPKAGRWISRVGWDSSITVGEPHPTFLAACRTAGHEPGSWPLPGAGRG